MGARKNKKPAPSVAAKKKIRNHIERNQTDCTVTPQLIAYWWRIINMAVFQGKLSQPKFTLNPPRDSWGIFRVYPIPGSGEWLNIAVSPNINNKSLLLSTIAHEMIHQWQYERHGMTNHRETYRQWKAYFLKQFNIKV